MADEFEDGAIESMIDDYLAETNSRAEGLGLRRLDGRAEVPVSLFALVVYCLLGPSSWSFASGADRGACSEVCCWGSRTTSAS